MTIVHLRSVLLQVEHKAGVRSRTPGTLTTAYSAIGRPTTRYRGLPSAAWG